jgi:hypothetical protein
LNQIGSTEGKLADHLQQAVIIQDKIITADRIDWKTSKNIRSNRELPVVSIHYANKIIHFIDAIISAISAHVRIIIIISIISIILCRVSRLILL